MFIKQFVLYLLITSSIDGETRHNYSYGFIYVSKSTYERNKASKVIGKCDIDRNTQMVFVIEKSLLHLSHANCNILQESSNFP